MQMRDSFPALVIVLLVSTGAQDQNPFYSEQASLFVASETVLSGIDISQSTVKQVIATLGEPTEILPSGLIKSIYTYERIAKSHTYEWYGKTCRLRVFTTDGSTITSVEVWGSRSEFDAGTTGKGLRLSATTDDVHRLYSSVSQLPVWSSANCGTATLLRVDFGTDGRVNHMKLTSRVGWCW